MTFLNLGILAHVDAGKTSLTERLLYDVGALDALGSVDDGTTQTDSDALERARGITIRSAAASFRIGDLEVNLIDTPGHPDFIAEVQRALRVLDGVVLVVSAVEGVQAHTRVLMRALRRLSMPTVLFVNKIDRAGARGTELLTELAETLTPAVLAMNQLDQLGTAAARSVRCSRTDRGFLRRTAELLADHDEGVLADFVAGTREWCYEDLAPVLAAQTAAARVHPVFFGSARTGAGIDGLLTGLREFLPVADGRADDALSGTVFGVDRDATGATVGHVRVWSGTLRTRDRVRYPAADRARITSIEVFEHGATIRRPDVRAGQIARLRGLEGVRIADTITLAGSADAAPGTGAGTQRAAPGFAPPSQETLITTRLPAERGALLAALSELAEQDPLINVRQDDSRGDIYLSLYGDIQKQVLQSRLDSQFGLAVQFGPTTTMCIERVRGPGEAAEIIGEQDNPFLATVGLRIEPQPVGTGHRFALGIELGSLPLSFITAVDSTVRSTLQAGLYGWPVPDALVTLTRSGYWPRQSHAHATFDKSMSSTAGDFRHLTPLVMTTALRAAGSEVLEPVHRFELETPGDSVAAVAALIARLRGRCDGVLHHGRYSTLAGLLPAEQITRCRQRLPDLSRGEAILETEFDHHEPVPDPPPGRSRTGPDPLHRREYLLRVTRRL